MADIHIGLTRNFTTMYNRLQAEYGEEFARINGFADEQLNYTDFIDNFIDEDTVADVSVDGSANVANKDIRTLMNEMPKPHRKLLAFNKIYYELNKKYGFKTANDWLRAQWNGSLYMHDADTSSYVHYCYKPEEMLLIKYNNKIYYVTFEELYNILEEEEIFDTTINQVAKFPVNLFVQDIDDEDNIMFTRIKRIVKHNNKKPMRFIKLTNGLSHIVTEDHPIITSQGEKRALDITNEDMLYTIQPTFFSKKQDSITTQHLPHASYKDIGTFKLTKELGWLTGMILSEGNWNNEISLAQNPGAQLDRIIKILDKYNFKYAIYNEENSSKKRVSIRLCPYSRWVSTFLKNHTASSKMLPKDFINYCDDFLDGVIAGMIDGDGTIDGYKHRHCQIRIASETLCHQLSSYLATKGVFCGDRIPHRYKGKSSFEQKLPLFGIGFTLTNEDYFLNIESIKINTLYEPRIRKKGNFANKKYDYHYGWVNVLENSEYIDDCSIVYDITTDTGHFICNNIVSHNCFAYDLKDLAEKGLYFLNQFNNEPAQHLPTFIDFLKEYISFASNRSSGAVGLPNLIPYIYYFWKKDCDEGYATKNPEYHAKQQIQRFLYALNQPYVRDGIQSAFTNVSIFDHKYLEALFGGALFPNGEPMIDSLDEICEFQKIFMEVVAEVRKKNMFTFPVLTISLLRKDKKFGDPKFADWAIQHNRIWSDSNIFIDDTVTSLSNCCRLKSNINDLGYFNSIGGSALKVGSVKVSTINLARIALETNTEEEYLKLLEERVLLNCKVLDIVRNIIKRNVEKGLLPNFSKGLVDFNFLYSTHGFIGIFETMKSFGYIKQDEFGNTFYTKEADAFGKKIFEIIHRTKNEFTKDKDYQMNCEQIPGESAAAKLQKADELLYPEKVIKDLPLYGNQFIPLGIKTTLQERIRIASTFDSYCNGGSIAHINIETPFTSFEQAKKMVEYIADQGLTYFAFNTKIQACKYNHGFYGTVCPICGGPVETEYSRIVGFYTPVKTWSKERKKEYGMREWSDLNEK